MELERRWTPEPQARDAGRIALALLRAMVARPAVFAATAGALLVVLVAGVWGSVLFLGYVGEHGIGAFLESVLGLRVRSAEGG